MTPLPEKTASHYAAQVVLKRMIVWSQSSRATGMNHSLPTWLIILFFLLNLVDVAFSCDSNKSDQVNGAAQSLS